MSYEFKSTSLNSRGTSSTLRVPNSNPGVTSLNRPQRDKGREFVSTETGIGWY